MKPPASWYHPKSHLCYTRPRRICTTAPWINRIYSISQPPTRLITIPPPPFHASAYCAQYSRPVASVHDAHPAGQSECMPVPHLPKYYLSICLATLYFEFTTTPGQAKVMSCQSRPPALVSVPWPWIVYSIPLPAPLRRYPDLAEY